MTSEQKKFEQWFKSECAIAITKKLPSGEYADSLAYWAWKSWQEAIAQQGGKE